MKAKWLRVASMSLVLIGALNWGLVALFGFNIVSSLFGLVPILEKWVYILIGASAVYVGIKHRKDL